jgi:hypothetical protein
MTTRNAHFHNVNESRGYPLDDTASTLSDLGERLPSGIITDLRLRWPALAGLYPFVSAVAVTSGAVSVTIQAADDLEDDSSFVPLAAFSLALAELEEGRQYRLESQYPQTLGFITFGSGVQVPYRGRFSSPTQTLLSPRAARAHRGLPVDSLGKLYNATALSGVVRLLGNSPIEVVKESRDILGIERDVIVVRLVDEPIAAAAGQPETNVFQQFAGPCGRRPESRTCGTPEPIEFINAVAPDCEGTLCLDFRGVVVPGQNLDDCGVVLDLPFGLSRACNAPFLPDHQGLLPSEQSGLGPLEPPDPEPEPEPEPGPPDSISESIIVLGELPYCDPFDGFSAADFVVKNGQWVFVQDDSPEEICGTRTEYPVVKYGCDVSISDEILPSSCSSVDSTGAPPDDIDSSYSAEGPSSAAQRNVTVWQGFDVTTLFRRVTTDVKLLAGPPGARRNGGLVINYREPTVTSSVYYVAELDHDTQTFRINRWNGTNFQVAVSVAVPGLLLDAWYRLIVETRPGFEDRVYLTARLLGIDDPSVNVTLGPLTTSNYLPDDGYFGFGTNRAQARFSFFRLEESP